MEGISIMYGLKYESIAKPSGPKITASKLKEGETYLYILPYKTRRILSIVGQFVNYEEEIYGECHFGTCKKSHFAKMCPNLCTPQEINFLSEKRLG